MVWLRRMSNQINMKILRGSGENILLQTEITTLNSKQRVLLP